MKSQYLFAILISLFVLQACTMAKISGRSSVPLMLNNPSVATELVSNFSETKLKTFDYTRSIDVYDILTGVVSNSNADAVTNLTVTIKSDPATFFINLVTIGIANAYKVQVTGDLIRLPDGLSDLPETNSDELRQFTPDLASDITMYRMDGIYQMNSSKN